MAELECLVIMPFESSFNLVFDTVRNAVTDAVPANSMDWVYIASY
jgi:hypothetical protein